MLIGTSRRGLDRAFARGAATEAGSAKETGYGGRATAYEYLPSNEFAQLMPAPPRP
jgi:hypothetical protein